MTRPFFAMLLVLLAGPTAAHRGHDAMTLVTIAQDGRVSVSHRFAAHDIEPALRVIAPDAQANLDDPQAVAALIAYLSRNFGFASDAGAVVLVPGGTETDSDEVRIVFTGTARRPIVRLTITNTIMSAIDPSQAAQVNIRYGKTVRTLVFRGGGGQTISLARSAKGAVRPNAPAIIRLS